LPGIGQLLLGKTWLGIVFISAFALLGFLYSPVRLPHSYFGLQLLILAVVAVCISSTWHALRSRTGRTPQPSRWWLVLVLPIALVASFAHSNWLFLAAGFRPFDVPSTGMERTILNGDRVVVDLEQYRNAAPRRGDVVVFKKEGTFFAKRVIAIGGDTVQGNDGVVMLNQKSLEEPYAIHAGNAPDQLNTFGPVTVSAGTVFVMGDNRDVSRDSRISDFGLVANDSVSGRCLYILRSKSGKVGRDAR
jgi:signal peptidase I